MKKLNQNNTIAPTAMMTKLNTMKNKMNFFAKVVMLVVMMVMLLPDIAYGQATDATKWKNVSGTWYILNESGGSEDDANSYTYTISFPTNESNFTASLYFKSNSGVNSVSPYVKYNNQNIVSFTVSGGGDNTVSKAFQKVNNVNSIIVGWTSGGLTGNNRPKSYTVSIPLPVHFDPIKNASNEFTNAGTNGTIDFGQVGYGDERTRTIEVSKLFRSYLTADNITLRIVPGQGVEANTFYFDGNKSEVEICGANAAYQTGNPNIDDISTTIRFSPKSLNTPTKTAEVHVIADGNDIGHFIVTGQGIRGTQVINWDLGDDKYINIGDSYKMNATSNDLTATVTYTVVGSLPNGATFAQNGNGEWILSIDAGASIPPGTTIRIKAQSGQTDLFNAAQDVPQEFEVTNLLKQTITWDTGFDDLATLFVNNVNDYVTFSATSTSGETVEFYINNTKLTNNRYQVTQTCDIQVTAKVAGNTIYLPTEDTRNFHVIVRGQRCNNQYIVDYPNAPKRVTSGNPISFGTLVPDKLTWNAQGTSRWPYDSKRIIITDNRTTELLNTPLGYNTQSSGDIPLNGNETSITVTLENSQLNSLKVTQKTGMMPNLPTGTTNNIIDFGDVYLGQVGQNEMTLSYSNVPYIELVKSGASEFTYEKTVLSGTERCDCHGETKYTLKFTPQDQVEKTCTLTFKAYILNGNQQIITIYLKGKGTKFIPNITKNESLPSPMNALYTVKNGNIPLDGYASVDNDKQTIEYKASDNSIAEVINGELQIKKAGVFTLIAYVQEATAYSYKEEELETCTVSFAQPSITPAISCGTENAFVFGEYKLSATSNIVEGTTKSSDGTITFHRTDDNLAELVTKSDGTYIHFLDRGDDDGTDVTVTVRIAASSDSVFDEGSTTLIVRAKKVTPKLTAWNDTMSTTSGTQYTGYPKPEFIADTTADSGQPDAATWPEGAVKISCESDNNNIAEVKNDGTIDAKKAGLVTITAKIYASKNYNASSTPSNNDLKVDFAEDGVDCGNMYVGATHLNTDVTDLIIPAGTLTATSDNPDFTVDISNGRIVVIFDPSRYSNPSTGTITFTDGDNGEQYHLNVKGGCLRYQPTFEWIDPKILKSNSTQENRQITDLLKSYTYFDGGVTIKSSDANVIKVYKADGTLAVNGEAGETFWACGAGQADITITVPGTDIHEGLEKTATFTVTTDAIRSIVWDQQDLLNNLYEGDGSFELTAKVVVDETGQEVGTVSSYAVTGEQGIVSVSNNNVWTLTINGTGTTTLTATASEDDGYTTPTLEYNVVVYEINKTPCGEHIIGQSNQITYTNSITFDTREDGTPYPAGDISFNYSLARRDNNTPYTITITESLPNGSPNTASTKSYSTNRTATNSGSEPAATNPFTLHRDATGLSFSGNLNYQRYFSNVKVTQATYLDPGTTTTADFGTCKTGEPKQMLLNSVAKYSNLNGPVRAVITSGNKWFKVVDSERNHFGGGCEDFGDIDVMVEYVADDYNVSHSGKLMIIGYNGTTKLTQEVTLNGISKNSVQTIVWPAGFEDGATIVASRNGNYYTIDLRNITTDPSGGTVSLSIYPAAGARINNTTLILTTDGYYTITATAAARQGYDKAVDNRTFYLMQGKTCGPYIDNETISNRQTYTFPEGVVPLQLTGNATGNNFSISDRTYTISFTGTTNTRTGNPGKNSTVTISPYDFTGDETGLNISVTSTTLKITVTQKTENVLRYEDNIVNSGDNIDFGKVMIGETSDAKVATIEYWNMPFMIATLSGDNASDFSFEQVVDGPAQCNCHGTTSYNLYFKPTSEGEKTCTLNLDYGGDTPLMLILTGKAAKKSVITKVKSLPAGLTVLDRIPLEGGDNDTYATVNTSQRIKYVALASSGGTTLSDVAEVETVEDVQYLKFNKAGTFYLKAYVVGTEYYTAAQYVFSEYTVIKATPTVTWDVQPQDFTYPGSITAKVTTTNSDEDADITYSVSHEGAATVTENTDGTITITANYAGGGKSGITVTATSVETDKFYEKSAPSASFDIDWGVLTLTLNEAKLPPLSSVSIIDLDTVSGFASTNYEEGVTYSYSLVSVDGGAEASIDANNILTIKSIGNIQIQVEASNTVARKNDIKNTLDLAAGIGTLTFSHHEGTDNRWDTKENWYPHKDRLPDTTNFDVLIADSCFIGKGEEEVSDETTFLNHTINAACHDLSFADNDNAKLVIGEASTLNVKGNLTNDDADKLLLTANYWGQASVVFGNNGEEHPNPKATVEMFIPGGNGSSIDPVWQYRGICVEHFSPITEVPLVDADGDPIEGKTINPWSYVYVFEWDESKNADKNQGCWVNGRSGSDITDDTPLQPWKGYCFANMIPVKDSALWLTYTGTLINSGKDTTLSYEYHTYDDGNGGQVPFANVGVNLITNSFAAPLLISKLGYPDSDFDCDKGIILYNAGSHAQWEQGINVGNQRGQAGQFSTVPRSTGEQATDIITIPAGQSFFVQATAANATLTLPYSTAISISPSTRMYLPGKEIEPEYNILKIRVTAKSDSAQDYVALLECETCTRQYDNGYDGKKRFGDSGLPQIYAYNKFGNTAVNADSTFNKQYVGFMAGSDDETYTISFETDRLFGYHSLFLTDRKLNETVDILAGETYQFKGYTVGENMRFQINGITEQEWNNYDDNDDDNDDDDDGSICDLRVVGNTLYVQGFTTEHYPAATIELFDMTGSSVWSTPLTSERIYDLPSLPNGIYTVRLGDCHVKYSSLK